MKQLKFLMVAFSLMMGISLTSCMGDSDPTVTGGGLMKVVSTYPTYTFKYSNLIDTRNYTASNTSSLSDLNLKVGDIVSTLWTYNSEQQQVTDGTTEILVQIDLTYTQNLSLYASSEWGEDGNKGVEFETATLQRVGFPAEASTKNGFQYYDENTLVFPIYFLYKSSDLSKYKFYLVYDPSSTESSDTNLNLYLRFSTTETEVTTTGYLYKAFDIRTALSDFKAKTGKIPEKIKVYANVTNKAGSNKLEDAKEELQSEEVDYKSVFEKN